MKVRSILDNDFVLFESACGRVNKIVNARVNRKKADIHEAISYLKENESLGEAAFYNFIYEEKIDDLLNLDLVEAIGHTARKIQKRNCMSLAEAALISKVVLSVLNEESEDDIENIKGMFGASEVEIPDAIDDEYQIQYTQTGKNTAIRKLADAQITAGSISDVANGIAKIKNFAEIDNLAEALDSIALLSLLEKRDPEEATDFNLAYKHGGKHLDNYLAKHKVSEEDYEKRARARYDKYVASQEKKKAFNAAYEKGGDDLKSYNDKYGADDFDRRARTRAAAEEAKNRK